MKANRLRWFLLFLLVSPVFRLPAQQSEADRKLLADIRVKAEKGDAQSQCELADTFACGRLGVATNYVEAVRWFRKSADQGYAKGQNGLGLMLFKGTGVSKNGIEALNWFRKSADQGYAGGQNSLGVMHH